LHEASNKETPCGNPIIPATGNKIEPEMDFQSSAEAGLLLRREYNKQWSGIGLFGKQWVSTYDYKLSFGSHDSSAACYPRPGGGTCGIGTNTIIYAHRPDARIIKFVKNASDGVFYEDKPGPVAKIVQQADGSFIYYSEDNDVEKYSSAGYVSEVKSEWGIGWTFSYSGTYPTRVTHTSGRYVDFVWSNGQLTSVRDPAGNYYGYAYHANRFGTGIHLLSATYKPGTPAATIAYHYEDTRFPGALTGKSYSGVRYSYFTYDYFGKAISSEHGGGRDRYTFSYSDSGEGVWDAYVTNPLGLTTNFTFLNGREQATNRQAAANCPAALSVKTVDTNGYVDYAHDFNNGLTDYDYNAKGQIIRQVEAAGTPQARTTEYVWDTVRNRLLSETVLGYSRTQYAYTADHRLASVTETNLSVHGVANQARAVTYTYTKHANGMLATVTEDGPIAGSGDAIVTTYNEYGDIVSVANSLGHTTTYANHNGLGLPGRITGANGDITDYVYDAQGRVTVVRRWNSGVAADTVTAYNAQGLVSTVTAPDGAVSNYEYDTARRLTRIWRVANGTVAGGASKEDQVYTYDLMGNVTRIDNRKLVGQYQTQCSGWRIIDGYPECINEQQVWVEVPTITESQFIDYDELGRVRARRGNNGQHLRYTYDGNGNVKTITDSSNRVTTLVYDALNRLTTSTDPLNSVTRFEYDRADRITKVTDPRNLNTLYTYDGFGQLWSQVSPDTGTTTFQYNANGQRTYATRNDGSALSFVYDSLGRLAWYGTSTEGRLFTYDWCQNGKGRLCEANYGLGAKHYGYTPYGQVAITRDFTDGLVTDDWTGYSYDNMGRLTGISYPSGVAAGYGYNNGKLTTMTATINGATQVVAGSINYHPFGGMSHWTYGNNLQRAMPIDLDGRLTGIQTTGIQGLNYQYNANDEITRITNAVDAGLTQDFGYDALSRLTSAAAPGNTMTLGYDGVGNRTTRHDTSGNLSTTYGYPGYAHHVHNAVMSNGQTRWFNHNGVGNIDAWHGTDGVYNSMVYDAYLRPKSHTRDGLTTNYRYNALDQRVLKSSGGGNTRYVYAGQNTLLAERAWASHTQQSVWTTHLYLAGQPVGVVKGSTLYWVHPDHLDRPEMATNGSGQRVWRAANWAFNRSVVQDQVGGYNLGFPGQYYDAESNLWQNGFRDYEPSLGRYMQSDPIGLRGGINTFAYASASPTSRIDPLGLKDHDECETRRILLKVYNNLNRSDTVSGKLWDNIPAVRIWHGMQGHAGGGTFDYKVAEEFDGDFHTFTIHGRSYSAAQFGNFAAGYAGGYFGLGGYSGVRLGGIAYDYIDGNSDWDRDSIDDIDAGYKMAKREIASGKADMCGCGE